jgi:hypothetical protein
VTIERTENWKQFTVYPPGCLNRFPPLQVLSGFLPDFIDATQLSQWHILFEPSALIRFAHQDPEWALACAKTIAAKHGLEMGLGDLAAPFTRNRDEGVDYHGEADVYGPELWEANKQFMQACGGLSMALANVPPEEYFGRVRKFMHLFCNILGMGYPEEFAIHESCARRSLELYEKYGRQ